MSAKQVSFEAVSSRDVTTMFVNTTRLPHVLKPVLYFCPDQYELERSRLFAPGWMFVGSVLDVPQNGDFFTCELLGQPILVRNMDGTIHTFLNVCPHRHCLLTDVEHGNHAKLTCQYHGWEFTADGRTGRIPDAQSFRPLPGGPECLRKFRTEVRGPLIFVSLNDQAIELAKQLGPLNDVCDEFPVTRWRKSESWSYDFSANWKVIVENTVESYHIPLIHPKTLIRYGLEEEIQHEIYENSTSMHSPIASPAIYRRVADWLLRSLEPECTHVYRLYHAFPSLFLIRVDAMLQVMTVTPTSAESCRLTVAVFTLRAARETLRTRLLTRAWGKFKSSVIKTVLAEDARLYPSLQRGMRSSPFQGTISTREELVYAFQDYVRRGCELAD